MLTTIQIYQYFHYTFLVNLMALLLVISTISSLFFLLLHVQSIIGHCPTNSSHHCQGDFTPIRFPFWIQDAVDPRCGYPGFDLTCNNQNQTIIHLPHSGDFMVTSIDYVGQSLKIDDPDNCLPGRFLNFNLSDTPFYGGFHYEYAFANCTSKVFKLLTPEDVPKMSYVACLSNRNYAVYYFPNDYKYAYSLTNVGCLVWTISIPVESGNVSWGDTKNRLWLQWDFPDCGSCELQGGTCIANTNTSVECKNKSGDETGISKSATMWIFIGVALPWFLCLYAVGHCSNTRVERHHRNQHHLLTNAAGQHHLPTNAAWQLSQPGLPGTVGLDAATIESYPKIQINGIHELPRQNDNTCTICLAEYQQRETIRIVPECNHYFHAYCIDQWLKRNATCPLCRNYKGICEPMDAS